MAKSVFSSMERFSTKFEDIENDGATVEAEVSVDVSVADGEAEATEIAETVAESEQVIEAVDEGENTAETLRFYADIVRKHGASPAFLAVIDADKGLSNLSGIVLPSSESLDATGRNQSTAEQIIQACEAAEKSVWERVKAFFRRLWESIKALGRSIINKFTSWETACKRAYDSIKDITLDSKKMQEDRQIVPTDKITSAIKAFNGIIKDTASVNEANLAGLGMKMEDGVATADSGAEFLKPKKAKVKTDLHNALKTMFTGADSISALFSQKGNVEKAIRDGENICKDAIADAERASKLSDDPANMEKIKKDNEERKKELRGLTKALGAVGKIAGAYVKNCAAVRACKAD